MRGWRAFVLRTIANLRGRFVLPVLMLCLLTPAADASESEDTCGSGIICQGSGCSHDENNPTASLDLTLSANEVVTIKVTHLPNSNGQDAGICALPFSRNPGNVTGQFTSGLTNSPSTSGSTAALAANQSATVVYTAAALGPHGATINIGPPTSSAQQNCDNPSNRKAFSYTATCTVLKGTLKIIKKTEGGDGSFTITATSGSAIKFSLSTSNGTDTKSKDVVPGTYTISETPPAGWELVSINCGTAGSTAVVTANSTTTCTVINRKKAKLTIKKQTVNGTGSFAFSASGPTAITTFNEDTTNANPSTGHTESNLTPGKYAFTETPPAGQAWTLTSVTCTGSGATTGNLTATSSDITLAAGADATCTFTNTKTVPRTGTVKITKKTDTGDGTFTFSSTLAAINNASLTTVGGTVTQTFSNITAGSFTVSENDPTAQGYTFGSLSCTETGGTPNTTTSGSTASITLEGGETVECTYNNTKTVPRTGTIKIEKISLLGTGTFSFTSNPVLAGLNPLTTVSAGQAVSETISNLSAGSYSITEAATAGWSFTSLSCTEVGGTANTTTNGQTANITLDAGETVTCTYTNTKRTAGLTLKKTASTDVYQTLGQVITYSYVVTNTGNSPLTNVSVTDDKVSPVNCPSTNLADGAAMTCTGTYVITTQDLTTCSVKNVATAKATPVFQVVGGVAAPAPVTATATATIKCDPDKTREVIRNFLNRRVDLLASNDPDRARMARRFDPPQQQTGSLKDDGPMKLLGEADAGSARFSFATSLSQIAQSNAAATRAKMAAAANGDGQMNLGASDAPALAYPQVPGVDVWIEGHFQRWDDGDAKLGDRSGNFGILYVAADYLLSPRILVGALVQFDWMDDKSTTLSTEVNGHGWMAGPYASIKLTDNIMFDARGAWGQSNNDIRPFATYQDSFDTDRWLAKANLMGNWFVQDLRISPSVGVIYVDENQHAYTDSLGNFIDGQSVHIGRMTFGPEFGYAIQRNDGVIIEPHVSFTGMWDFDKDSTATIAGRTTSTDDFRVKVEGGLMVRATNGMSVRATVSYDGLASDDLSAWGGQLWLSVPLN